MTRPAQAGDPAVTVTYVTQISSTRVGPGGAGNATNWLPGIPLTVGFSWPPEQPLPTPTVVLGDQDVSDYVALYAMTDGRLKLDIDLMAISDLVCPSSPRMYLKAEAVLAPDGASFTGNVPSTCASPLGAPPFDWIGVSDSSGADRHQQMVSFFTAYSRLTTTGAP